MPITGVVLLVARLSGHYVEQRSAGMDISRDNAVETPTKTRSRAEELGHSRL
jgi:hypothetical protein